MGHSSPRSQAKTTPCNSLNIFSTNRSTQARWPRRPLSALTSAPPTPVSGFSSTERLRSSPTTRATEPPPPMSPSPTLRLIGDPAKNQVAINPTNTIFDAKRLIGRKYDDSTVQSDMKHWPFKVAQHGDKPKLEVEYKNETKT